MGNAAAGLLRVIVAFGLERKAGLPTAAAVLVAINITAVIPLTPANVGVFQAACIAVLAPAGVSAAEGLANRLVLQAMEILSALSLGLPAMVYECLSFGGLRRRPEAEPQLLGAG